MLDKNTLQEIQVDITSYCNSFCPGCSRNVDGGAVNDRLPLMHMDKKVWQEIARFVDNYPIKSIIFNGNYGDASNHPMIVEMLDMITKKDIEVLFHTNGGARDTIFWKNLAESLSTFKLGIVVFSIDGLVDTNHLHRRNVDWDALMNNVSSFINSGGKAKWRMILFEHNVHQIKQAKKMAMNLGFASFSLHRSYFKNYNIPKYKNFQAYEIIGVDENKVKKYNTKYRYETKEFSSSKIEKYKLESLCPWQEMARIQIDVDGTVWPCCYQQYRHDLHFDWQLFTDTPSNEPMLNAYKTYGRNFNVLTHSNLDSILDSKFFQNDLAKFWKKKTSNICIEHCLKRR